MHVFKKNKRHVASPKLVDHKELTRHPYLGQIPNSATAIALFSISLIARGQHGAHMRPAGPGGPHGGPIKFVIWVHIVIDCYISRGCSIDIVCTKNLQ